MMERNESLTPEYTCLLNGLTDTIQEVEALLLKLKRLQAAAEELYLERDSVAQAEAV